jgi:hypothetical protein
MSLVPEPVMARFLSPTPPTLSLENLENDKVIDAPSDGGFATLPFI